MPKKVLTEKTVKAKPVLKWVGGKRQLIKTICPNIPKDLPEGSRYFEPFLGGGSVFFELAPTIATISDLNSELINVYLVVRDHPEELITALKRFTNTEECFYAVRNIDRDSVGISELSDIEKAARTIYLNKTCFNGYFRVNARGQFNTPYAHYPNSLDFIGEANIRTVSALLNSQTISILCCSFAKALEGVKAGDFVYLDPPYDPVNGKKYFDGYTAEQFNRAKQIELAKACDEINAKGAFFMLSNSATKFIKSLYLGKGYHVYYVLAKRNISAKPSQREPVEEVLVTNYKIEDSLPEASKGGSDIALGN